MVVVDDVDIITLSLSTGEKKGLYIFFNSSSCYFLRRRVLGQLLCVGEEVGLAGDVFAEDFGDLDTLFFRVGQLITNIGHR